LKSGLQAMLAPVEQPDGVILHQVIEDPQGLPAVNPFAPYMPANIIAQLDEFAQEHPTGRLAVILRPCELRTLHVLQKHGNGMKALDGRLIVIGVDCAGTYPAGTYRQAGTAGREGALTDLLCYSAGDGPPKEIREACQLCEWPAPSGADTVIGFLGTASDGILLVIPGNGRPHSRLELSGITDGPATAEQASRRDLAISQVAAERAVQRAMLAFDPTYSRGDLTGLLACLSRCTLCADCLDACPLYNGELSGMLGVGYSQQRQRPLLSELIDLSRWLASCSGCGMCQEACTHGVALMPFISIVSHRIRQELGVPSLDPLQLVAG
jgi:formate dehydrogenase (coenzyme F420) beta subunit